MTSSQFKRAVSAAILGVVFIAGNVTGSAAAATSAATKAAATKAAADAKNAATNSANSLKISPVRSNVTVQPGSSQSVTVTVTNLTAAPVMLKPIENDFVAGDEKGTPSIILDENSYAPTHSLKRFMVPLQNVLVPAGQSKDVAVTIKVPASAKAGGYYGALRFAPVSADGSNTVNIATSVASLILMTVPGDLVESLQLTNFDVQQDGSNGTNFRTPNDLQLFLRFKNNGNVQLEPFGKIYVKKGSKVVYSTDFNNQEPRQDVLPDSARRWNIKLSNLGRFGKYTIGATFGYGSKGQTLDVEKTIWIVPTTYIYLAIGSVVGLLVLITGFIIFLRSYKRRILRGSRRRY